MGKQEEEPFDPLAISDDDIYQAMREISGYLDITPGDFKEVYRAAYRHALERLRRAVKAADIMTRKVHTVQRDTPLAEVAALMAEAGVAGLPVLEPTGQVAGVISEHDFLNRLGNSDCTSFMAVIAACLGSKKCAALKVRGRCAGDIMSAPPVTVDPETPAVDVAALLNARGINRVPVVDDKKNLLGIISRGDLIGTTHFPEARKA